MVGLFDGPLAHRSSALNAYERLSCRTVPIGHGDRLEACLAIDLVVAWRIYQLNKLGREHPDAACTLYFEDAE